MEFKSLSGKPSVTKKPRRELPVNIAMRLDHIALGTDGNASFFRGFRVGDEEPIAVRMMTIDEGIEVNVRSIQPEKDGDPTIESNDTVRARLVQQYSGTGDKHRPKPAEIASPTNKTHCETGGLLMFTKCKPNPDGSFRAHWVETLEAKPGSGCDKVTAHVSVKPEYKDCTPTGNCRVFADVVNPDKAVMVTQENAMATLAMALANKDGDVNRKPFAVIRLVNAETGKLETDPVRVSAKYDKHEITDGDTGQKYDQFSASPATESISQLFNPEYNPNRDVMVARAALFGLGKVPGYPNYKGVDEPDLVADLNSITDYVRGGALKIEVIPGERINAGPSTRASISAAVGSNKNHPINRYTGKVGSHYEARFCETFITTQVGKDGNRFFTKASPVDLYPGMTSLKFMATANDHVAVASEALARSKDASADVPVSTDAEYDPSAGENDLSVAAVDARLVE